MVIVGITRKKSEGFVIVQMMDNFDYRRLIDLLM
jgi:hypothetical protein